MLKVKEITNTDAGNSQIFFVDVVLNEKQI
jgi:hypothetical protein